jgi:hypothetical protein
MNLFEPPATRPGLPKTHHALHMVCEELYTVLLEYVNAMAALAVIFIDHSFQISSSAPDLHSGVEGGAVTEPMLDM